MTTPRERLEELRAALRAENISYGELAELQDLAPHIEAGDVELLEAAGVPEGVAAPGMRDYYFVVRVDTDSREHAEQVMGERPGPDEDYGFDYTVEWSDSPYDLEGRLAIPEEE